MESEDESKTYLSRLTEDGEVDCTKSQPLGIELNKRRRRTHYPSIGNDDK